MGTEVKKAYNQLMRKNRYNLCVSLIENARADVAKDRKRKVRNCAPDARVCCHKHDTNRSCSADEA